MPEREPIIRSYRLPFLPENLDPSLPDPVPGVVAVFGSNRQGKHKKGMADTALRHYGARMDRGHGFQGSSYAIPTREFHNGYLRSLDLESVRAYVYVFLDFARQHPDIRFLVTRIGCGYAGFTDEQIAPLFFLSPSNCILPEVWKPFVRRYVLSIIRSEERTIEHMKDFLWHNRNG